MPVSGLIARRPGDDQLDDARAAGVGHAIALSNVLSGLVSKYSPLRSLARCGPSLSVSARISGRQDMVWTTYSLRSITGRGLGRRLP